MGIRSEMAIYLKYVKPLISEIKRLTKPRTVCRNKLTITLFTAVIIATYLC